MFSLTRQAVQLGYWPRVTIKHTSGDAEGQIYVPEMNFALMIGCVWLVFAFRVEGLRVWRRRTVSRSPAPWASPRSCLASSRTRSGAGLRRTMLLVGFFLVIDISFFRREPGEVCARWLDSDGAGAGDLC